MMSTTQIVDLEDQFRSFFPKTQFSTFDEFNEIFREFQRATATNYIISASTGVDKWLRDSRKTKISVPDSIKYKYAYFKCIHSTRKKSKEVDSRKYKNLQCESRISLIYRKGKLHLDCADLKHNHPIAMDNPEFYARNRSLTADQEAVLSQLLDGDLSAGQITEYIYVNFGIRLNSNDVRHLLDRKRKSSQIGADEEVACKNTSNKTLDTPNPAVPRQEPDTILPVVPTPAVNPLPYPIMLSNFVCTQDNTPTTTNNISITTKDQQILKVITDLYNVLRRFQANCVDEHLSFIQSYTAHLSQSQCDLDEPVCIVLDQPPSTACLLTSNPAPALVAQPVNQPMITTPKATSSKKCPPKVKCVSEIKPPKPVVTNSIPQHPVQPVQPIPGLRPILPRPPDLPRVAIPVTLGPDNQCIPTTLDDHTLTQPCSPQPSPNIAYEDEDEDTDEAREEEPPEVTILSSSDENSLSTLLNTTNPQLSPDASSYVFTRKSTRRRKPVLVTRGSPVEIIDEYFPD